jgi:hypothetical protein
VAFRIIVLLFAATAGTIEYTGPAIICCNTNMCGGSVELRRVTECPRRYMPLQPVIVEAIRKRGRTVAVQDVSFDVAPAKYLG